MHRNFTSFGNLGYSEHWLVVDCCDELARYYRRFIKEKCLTSPPYGAHITVVAGPYETALKPEFWRKYEGQQVKFEYGPDVKYGDGWYWLEIDCNFLSNLRLELGLAPTPKWPFHLTVARDDEYFSNKIASA